MKRFHPTLNSFLIHVVFCSNNKVLEHEKKKETYERGPLSGLSHTIFSWSSVIFSVVITYVGIHVIFIVFSVSLQ